MRGKVIYEKRQVLYLSVNFLPAYFASVYVHRKRRYTKGTVENPVLQQFI